MSASNITPGARRGGLAATTGQLGGCQMVIFGAETSLPEGIRAWSEAQPHVKFFADVRSLGTAEELIKANQPQLAVVSLDLAEAAGLEWIRGIRYAFPEMLLLIVVESADVQQLEMVLRRGVHGIIARDQDLEEFHKAVATVSRGDIYLSQGLTRQMLKMVYLENRGRRRRAAEIEATVTGGIGLASPAY